MMISRIVFRQYARAATSTCRATTRVSQLSPIATRFIIPPTQISRQSRLYSSETEASKTDSKDASTAAPAAADDASKKELEAKTKEAADFKDKYIRQVAEFRNLQEITKRQVQAAKDFALQRFAKDLIESIDNLDRALTMVPEDKLASKEESTKDVRDLYDGLKMTEKILMQTLEKHGLERFDPKDVPFNPNEHEATFMTPMKDLTDGNVFHTQSKGFKLNGRVLRAAKVGVVKNS